MSTYMTQDEYDGLVAGKPAVQAQKPQSYMSQEEYDAIQVQPTPVAPTVPVTPAHTKKPSTLHDVYEQGQNQDYTPEQIKEALGKGLEQGGPMGLGFVGADIADALKGTPIGKYITEPIRGAMANVSAGFSQGNARFNESWLGLSPDTNRWQTDSDYYKEVALSHGIDPESFAGEVYQSLGGAPMGIAEYLAGIPYGTIQGAKEAHAQGHSPVVGAVKGGLERLFLGKVFKSIEQMGLNPLQSRALLGGIFGTQAAVEGGDIQDIGVSMVTGLALGGGRGGKETEIFNNLVKTGVPREKASELARLSGQFLNTTQISTNSAENFIGENKRRDKAKEPAIDTPPIVEPKLEGEVNLEAIQADLEAIRIAKQKEPIKETIVEEVKPEVETTTEVKPEAEAITPVVEETPESLKAEVDIEKAKEPTVQSLNSREQEESIPPAATVVPAEPAKAVAEPELPPTEKAPVEKEPAQIAKTEPTPEELDAILQKVRNQEVLSDTEYSTLQSAPEVKPTKAKKEKAPKAQVDSAKQEAFKILKDNPMYKGIKVFEKGGKFGWKNTKEKTTSTNWFTDPSEALADGYRNKADLTIQDYPPIPEGSPRAWKLEDGSITTNPLDIAMDTNPAKEVGYYDMSNGSPSFVAVEARPDIMTRALESLRKARIGLTIIDIAALDYRKDTRHMEVQLKRKLNLWNTRRSVMDYLELRELENIDSGQGVLPSYQHETKYTLTPDKLERVLPIKGRPEQLVEWTNSNDNFHAWNDSQYPVGVGFTDTMQNPMGRPGRSMESTMRTSKAHERAHSLWLVLPQSERARWEELHFNGAKEYAEREYINDPDLFYSFPDARGNKAKLQKSYPDNANELWAETMTAVTMPRETKTWMYIPEAAKNLVKEYTKPKSAYTYIGEVTQNYKTPKTAKSLPYTEADVNWVREQRKLWESDNADAGKLQAEYDRYMSEHTYLPRISLDELGDRIAAESAPQISGWPSIDRIKSGFAKYISQVDLGAIGLSIREVSSKPEDLAQSRLAESWGKIIKASGSQNALDYAEQKLGIPRDTASSMQDAFVREIANRMELIKETREEFGKPTEPSLPKKAHILMAELGLTDVEFKAIKLQLTGKESMGRKAADKMDVAEKKAVVDHMLKLYEERFEKKYEFELKASKKRKSIEAISGRVGEDLTNWDTIKHFWKVATTSGRDWLDKTPTGKLITKALDSIQDNSTLLSGDLLSKFYLDKKSMVSLNDTMVDKLNSGKTWPEILSGASGKELELLTSYKHLTQTIAQMAVDRGVKVQHTDIIGGKVKVTEVPFTFDAEKPYFPRMYPDKYFEKNDKIELAIQSLMKPSNMRPRGRTRREAIKIWDEMLKSKHGLTKNPNLEYAREYDVPGYNKNLLEVITLYTTKSAKRLYSTDYFGFDGRKISLLLDRVEKEGGERDIVDYTMSSILGQRSQENQKFKKLADIATSFQVITKMGLSVIPQMSQIGYVFEETNMKTMVKSLAKVAVEKKDSKEFAYRSGVILASVIKEHMDMLQGNTVTDRFLTRSGFLPVDRMNRVFAAVAGREYAKDTFEHYLRTGNKSSEHRLKLLGVDANGIKREGRTQLAEEELRMAGLRMSNLTQFRSNAMELPIWTTKSPMARVVTLFHSFAYHRYKQLEKRFTNDKTFFFRRLVPMLISAGLSGAVVQELRDLIKGNQQERTGLEKIARYYAASGGIGIMSDAVQQGMKSDSGLVKFMAGVTASDISKYFYDGFNLVSEGKFAPVARDLIGIAPAAIAPFSPGTAAAVSGVIGPQLKQAIFPYEQRKAGDMNLNLNVNLKQ